MFTIVVGELYLANFKENLAALKSIDDIESITIYNGDGEEGQLPNGLTKHKGDMKLVVLVH
jgi:hypothetical protein